MGKKIINNFEDLINGQIDSNGWSDFITRMPYLWYNQLTNAGSIGYRHGFLRTFPIDSEKIALGGKLEIETLEKGEELPRSLVYSGHMISFSKLSNGIRTVAHPLADAPNMFLNRGKLGNSLRKTGVLEDNLFDVAHLTKPSLVYESPKDSFDIDGVRSYVIVDVESKDKRMMGKGSIEDLWKSYKQRVFVPLASSIMNW